MTHNACVLAHIRIFVKRLFKTYRTFLCTIQFQYENYYFRSGKCIQYVTNSFKTNNFKLGQTCGQYSCNVRIHSASDGRIGVVPRSSETVLALSMNKPWTIWSHHCSHAASHLRCGLCFDTMREHDTTSSSLAFVKVFLHACARVIVYRKHLECWRYRRIVHVVNTTFIILSAWRVYDSICEDSIKCEK